MIDKTCYSIEHHENNFRKIMGVESELLWGTDREEEIFLTILIITYKSY